jgi:hypothetical protein
MKNTCARPLTLRPPGGNVTAAARLRNICRKIEQALEDSPIFAGVDLNQ